MADSKDKRITILIFVVLTLTTLGLYWPVLHSDFVFFDDETYVFRNAHVKAGLTLPGLVWAFQTPTASNWNPMVWLSFMVDTQIFGTKPTGYHLTNLLLHVANTLLLFSLLRRMTGTLWRSAAVAALFAWHPLHVESVAWVTERKDVLSTCFWLLALLAYVRYAQASANESEKPVGLNSKVLYLLALVMFGLGLMAKAMLVTLPFLLLLIDYWPLGRLQLTKASARKDYPKRIAEKIPFFLLALASSRMTLWAQSQSDPASLAGAPELSERIANTLVAYVQYLRKMFWPDDLAVFYPYVRSRPDEQIIGAGLVLAIITALVIATLRKRPYLAVGWFWYLGTLIPVSGLIQFGSFCMADRYTYIPLIGLFIALLWVVNELMQRGRLAKVLGIAVVSLALAGAMAATSVQVGYWKNTETLFKHNIAVTGENYLACNNLASYFVAENRPVEALEYFAKAKKLNPSFPEVYVNSGYLLEGQNRLDEANEELLLALRIAPRSADAHYHLGRVLVRQGKLPEAIDHFQMALQENPDWPAALRAWGNTLARQGKFEEAMPRFIAAIRIDAKDADAEAQLASALAQLHRLREAVEHYHTALRLKPDAQETLNNFAWLLAASSEATIRNGAEAVTLAKRACELSGEKEAIMLGTLGAAYAEDGQFENAVKTAQQATAVAIAAGQTEIAKNNEELAKLYQAKQPFHEAP